MLRQKDRVDSLGATVLFVAYDPPGLLRETMLAGLDVLYPVLIDADRSAYRRWGLERAPLAAIWGDPRVWGRYALMILGGERLHRPGSDTLQLGGDFVVDSTGVIAYSRPQKRDDRPPVGVLLRELANAR